MADPTSRGLLLRRAIAADLAAAGIGVYRPDGPNYVNPERGIRTDGPNLPTTFDNCIVLTSLPTISDGRADIIDRVQIYGRVKGNSIAAENLEHAIWDRYDQKPYLFPAFGNSWTWRFSMLQFEPDTQGRSAFAATYYFRNRR